MPIENNDWLRQVEQYYKIRPYDGMLGSTLRSKREVREDEDMSKLKIELSQEELNKATVTNLSNWYRNRYNVHKIYDSLLTIKSAVGIRINNTVNYGLLLGYIYQEKTYHSVHDLMNVIGLSGYEKHISDVAYNRDSNIKALVYLLDFSSGKSSIKVINGRYISAVNEDRLRWYLNNKFLNIKINSSELSAKIFGLAKVKAELVGTTTNNYLIERSSVSKLAEETLFIKIPHNDKWLKFCLDDIDFQFPNIIGYNPPKDKTITVNSIVRLMNNKNCRSIEKDSRLVVEIIKPNPKSARLSKNSNNRKLDVVYARYNNTRVTVYAKDLKLIK